MQWIKPQSRFVVKQILKRNYEVMTPEAQSQFDLWMLMLDLILLVIFVVVVIL